MDRVIPIYLQTLFAEGINIALLSSKFAEYSRAKTVQSILFDSLMKEIVVCSLFFRMLHCLDMNISI